MGTVSSIIWCTAEYEEEVNEALEKHIHDAEIYHRRRLGLGMCGDVRRSGINYLASGQLFKSATVDLAGRLRVHISVHWGCKCRYKRTYVRQLHYYADGDQLRIAVTE